MYDLFLIRQSVRQRLANLQIRLDESLKAQAQAVTADMGMDVATAVRIFLAQMVRERAMPFTPSLDRFHSPQNQAHLARVARDMDTTHQLRPLSP